MPAEIIIIDNRAVSVDEAARLLGDAGQQPEPAEVAALVERIRREQPPGSRSYFAHCEHGAYVVTWWAGSTRPDSVRVRQVVAGLHSTYG